MLSDEQKTFLRKYLNGTVKPPDKLDHEEAGRIWDQVAEAITAAAELKKDIDRLTVPDRANDAETGEIDRLKAEAEELLAGPLNETNAFEAVADAKSRIKGAEDAILQATQRISSDEAAWTEALGSTRTLIDTSGLNDVQIKALRAAVTEVGTPAQDLGDTAALIVKLGAIGERCTQLVDAVAAGNKRVAASETLPGGLYKAEIDLIATARETAVDALATMVDHGSIAAAAKLLDALDQQIKTGAAAASTRAKLRDALEVEKARLDVPNEATQEEDKAISEAKRQAEQVLEGSPEASVLEDAIRAAKAGVLAVEAAKARIRDALAAWQEGVSKVENGLKAGRTFPLAESQTAAVRGKIEAARAQLAKDLSNVANALAALDEPTKLLKLIADGIDALQAKLALVAPLHADALKAEEDKYKAAKDEAVAAIAAFTDAAGIKPAEDKIAALVKLQAAIQASVDKRKDLLKTVSKERMNAVCTALGSSEALDAIVAGVKPDASGLFDDTKIAPAALAKLYKDALGGNAAVLSAVYQTGFAGDAGKLNAFAGSLDDAERGKVTAMITTGGFAEAPAALGELLKAPGGADKLKDLGTAFNDGPSLAKLKAAVTQGGLGGANARSPDVLASVLGVTSAADLKKHIEGFGPTGMDEMRAMLSAFDGTPPPSEAGKAFATVAARVCPPDNGMKTQFFGTLDKSSAMSGASKALQKAPANPDVTAAAKAIGRSTDAIALGGLSTTLAGASALQAAEGIPGVDTAKRDLLKEAIKASGTATVAMAEAAKLSDKAAAKKAAEAKLDPSDPGAAGKANAAATAAGLEADAKRLALVDPITAALLKDAAKAAADAVKAAAAAPDDAIRTDVLDKAKACFDAVTKATTTIGQAVADDARGKAEVNAVAKSKVEGAKVTNAAGKQALQDLYQDHVDNAGARALRYAKLKSDATAQLVKDDDAVRLAEDEVKKLQLELNKAKGKPGEAVAQKNYDDAKKVLEDAKKARTKTKQAETNAEANRAKEEKLATDGPGNLAAAKLANSVSVAADRKTGLVEIQTASNQAEASRNAKLIADTPALQAAFAKAARLRLLADSPDATTEDHLAAAEADSEAAIALADAAATPTIAAVDALKMPSLDGKTDPVTETYTEADKLIAAALDIKQALALSILRQEKAQVAYVAQERIALDARSDVALFGDVDPYKKTLTDAVAKLVPKEAERVLAATKSRELAGKAKTVDDSLTKHIGLHTKAIAKMTTGTPEQAKRVKERDKLLEAAAIIVLALNRSYSAGYPSMNRDQLLSVASTMNKSPLTGMGAKDPVPGTDAKVDMEHFCGRHTREFCSFEGRDLNDYDEAMGVAIMEAMTKGQPAGDLTDEQRACRDGHAQIKTTSMWPGGFDKADVEACLKLTFIEVEKRIPGLNSGGAKTIRSFLDLPNDQKTHKSTQFAGIVITHKSQSYTVQIGFSVDPTDTSKFLVGQFFPSSTPSVPFADMHALKAAMKH